MTSGYIVRRGKEYLARKNCKSTYSDENGWCWSAEVQAARTYDDLYHAMMAARRVGGTVKLLTEGRVLE